MSTGDIPLGKAELLSTMLEALFYGLSLPLFGGTIWALSSQRSTHRINRKMLTVACLLLLCSTTHMVIRIIRTMEGLVFLHNTSPGGPVAYFSDVSQWTFVGNNYVYTAQTLIGDGVILYRCYMVWRSKLIMILPTLLWCVVAVTGIACPYTESHTTQDGVFEGSLSRWITAFWASTLTTNLLATLLLAYRIWYIDQKTSSPPGPRKSQLRPVLYIVIDAGMIYSFTLSAALICFLNRSNGQYVILDAITPIISITFYMVIIRVGLANWTNQTMNSHLPGCTNTVNSVGVGDRRSRIIPITTLVENNIDNDRLSSMNPRAPIAVVNNRRSEFKFDDVTEEA